MDMSVLSDDAVLTELCQRLKATRLNANISQEELAEVTGVGLRTILRLEKGNANVTLLTLIALLRGLNKLDQIDLLLTQTTISPIELSKLKGKTRQRASQPRTLKQESDAAPEWSWGDEKNDEQS